MHSNTFEENMMVAKVLGSLVNRLGEERNALLIEAAKQKNKGEHIDAIATTAQALGIGSAKLVVEDEWFKALGVARGTQNEQTT